MWGCGRFWRRPDGVLGNDMTKVDDFTTAMMCNDEMLAVDQRSVGEAGEADCVPGGRGGECECRSTGLLTGLGRGALGWHHGRWVV